MLKRHIGKLILISNIDKPSLCIFYRPISWIWNEFLAVELEKLHTMLFLPEGIRRRLHVTWISFTKCCMIKSWYNSIPRSAVSLLVDEWRGDEVLPYSLLDDSGDNLRGLRIGPWFVIHGSFSKTSNCSDFTVIVLGMTVSDNIGSSKKTPIYYGSKKLDPKNFVLIPFRVSKVERAKRKFPNT